MSKKIKLNYDQTYATSHSRDYYRGKSFHFSGKWVPGAHYVSDDYNLDFVTHGQNLLACAKSHLSTVDNEPTQYVYNERGDISGVASIYWDFVLGSVKGADPGIKIEENYWWICDDISLPEDEQVWTNTGVKAKMELDDLSEDEIALLQRPGKQVVDDFVANVITQETGYYSSKIMSQECVTKELDDIGLVVGEHIAELWTQVSNLIENHNVLDNASASSLTLAEILKINGADFVINGQSAPTKVPDFIGQIYNDTTNKVHYAALGNSSVSDWVALSKSSELDSYKTTVSTIIDNINSSINTANGKITTNTNNIASLTSRITTEESTRSSADIAIQNLITQESETRTNIINQIYSLVPTAATSTNQLADKSFVHNEIATSSATFRGTYSTLSELQQQTADNNDYGFVVETDALGNTTYNRYRYDGTTWTFEYTINSTEFSQSQWDAINSGINSTLVTKLSELPTNANLQSTLDGKVNVVSGKQLSTEDYTTSEKTKLSGIESGAEVNVQADWTQSDSSNDSYIKNKPTALKNPESLTFGSKTYNGSTAQTITATDLGALTTHQDISGKADKVTNAINGNFASLNASGNLVDSGKKASDFQVAGSYKTTQTAVSDPTASGNSVTFISGITQNTNGVITPSKATVRSASASQSGLMSSSDYSKLAGIASGAQVNVIETVKVDDTALTPDTSKAVNIDLTGKVNVPKEETVDSEFYFRQTSDGNVDYNGNARINNIKGKTLVWNQLAINGTADTLNGKGSNDADELILENGYVKTTGGRYDGVIFNLGSSPIVEHKYYISHIGYATDNDWRIDFDGRSLTRIGTTLGMVSTIMTYTGQRARLYCLNYRSQASTLYTKYLFIVDLTLMFGAGNEPETVEEFEAMFPLDYYDYDEGRLLNLTADGIVTNGFNQWDEEWEIGRISYEYGTKSSSVDHIRSRNFIPCLPNTTYYIHISNAVDSSNISRICCYDADKHYIQASWTFFEEGIYITPANAAYIMFFITATTYNHGICINLSDSSKNGTYEPYWKRTADLPITTLTGKLNGEGSSVVVFPDGMKSAGTVHDELTETKAIKRIGVVDLGTLQWSTDSGCFVANVSTIKNHTVNTVCNNYITSSVLDLVSFTDGTHDKEVYVANNESLKPVFIIDSSYTTVATFKSAMSGVLLYYELAEPEEYILDEPLNLDYNYDYLGTEKVLPENTSVPTTTPLNAEISYNEAIINDVNVEGITEYVKRTELVKYDTSDDVDDKLNNYKTVASLQSKGDSNLPVYFDSNGNAQPITDLTLDGTLSGNAFKVIAEHIAELESRIANLESGKDSANSLTATSVDSANGYFINGDKTVIFGSGAPTAIPAFVGQFYINTSGPALYYSTGNGATTDWKQA